MLLALIIVGFAMLTVGMALLLLGEVPLLGGRRIPAGRARIIGGIFVCFLPMALAVRLLCNLFLDLDNIAGPIITWSLLALCLIGAMAMLFRVVFPKDPMRCNASTKKPPTTKNPFESASTGATAAEVPWVELEPIPPKPASGRTRPTNEADPFDFS